MVEFHVKDIYWEIQDLYMDEDYNDGEEDIIGDERMQNLENMLDMLKERPTAKNYIQYSIMSLWSTGQKETKVSTTIFNWSHRQQLPGL